MEVTCPECGAELSIDDSMADEELQCSNCETVFEIESYDDEEDESEQAEYEEAGLEPRLRGARPPLAQALFGPQAPGVMAKRVAIVLGAAALVFFCTSIFFMVAGGRPAPAPDADLAERFAALNRLAWHAEPGALTCRGDSLILEGDKGVAAIFRPALKGDFELSFDGMIEPRKGASSISDLSILLHVPDDPANASNEGYFIGFGSDNNTRTKVLRKSAEIIDQAAKRPLKAGTVYHLRFTYRNRTICLTYSTDESPGETGVVKYTGGAAIKTPGSDHIGFYTYGSKATFSKIRITRLAAGTPAKK